MTITSDLDQAEVKVQIEVEAFLGQVATDAAAAFHAATVVLGD